MRDIRINIAEFDRNWRAFISIVISVMYIKDLLGEEYQEYFFILDVYLAFTAFFRWSPIFYILRIGTRWMDKPREKIIL